MFQEPSACTINTGDIVQWGLLGLKMLLLEKFVHQVIFLCLYSTFEEEKTLFVLLLARSGGFVAWCNAAAACLELLPYI